MLGAILSAYVLSSVVMTVILLACLWKDPDMDHVPGWGMVLLCLLGGFVWVGFAVWGICLDVRAEYRARMHRRRLRGLRR